MQRLVVALAIAGLAISAGALTREANGAAGSANGRIAFTRQSPYDGGAGQIVLANANGSGLVSLTLTRGWGTTMPSRRGRPTGTSSRSSRPGAVTQTYGRWRRTRRR